MHSLRNRIIFERRSYQCTKSVPPPLSTHHTCHHTSQVLVPQPSQPNPRLRKACQYSHKQTDPRPKSPQTTPPWQTAVTRPHRPVLKRHNSAANQTIHTLCCTDSMTLASQCNDLYRRIHIVTAAACSRGGSTRHV